MRNETSRLCAAILVLGVASLTEAGVAAAQEPSKIGLILPLTGPFASTGRQVESGARLYLQQHGRACGGGEVELLVRDDAGTPDTTKRLAQELVVRDGAEVLAGFGLTPLAMATAPIATQARTPMVVMGAATSSITEASPYIVRTSFTLPQVSAPMARWAAEQGIAKVATIVTDYAPGLDAAKTFQETFTGAGGEVVAELRVPLRNPDFAPFLQRAKDAAPDAVFVFVPSGVGAIFMKQFSERGLAQSGIKLIGTGDVTDDDILDSMGDAALGVITAHHYSAAHDSAENRAFVGAFRAANNGLRPNFMAIGGYDGMRLICAARAKAGSGADGQALVEAMKGMAWESPRGPVTIDPETRDIVQNVYIRAVERVDGQLFNVEFDRIEAVKDPGKAG